MDIGGKGTNQAVAAARLGANVKIVAMVGDDMFADECIKKLKAAGVKTDLVGKASDIHTGGASITVDEKGRVL
jgi:ribokinase